MSFTHHHIERIAKKYLVWVCMMVWGLMAYPQIAWDTPSFTLSSQEGLPDNYIKGIAEDRYGFTWISSNSGLSRYDGTRIEVIASDKLPKSYFSSLYVDDKRDILWIGTYLGLYNMNLQTQEIIRVNPEEEAHSINNFINSLYRDRNDRLWVATRKGFNKIDLKTQQIQKYLIKTDTSKISFSVNNQINSLIQDPVRDHIFWVGSQRGLFIYDIETQSAQKLIPKLEKLSGSRPIAHLYQDPGSSFIYASIKTAIETSSPYQYLKIDTEQGQIIKGISIKKRWRNGKFFFHSPGKFWFSTNEGTAICNTLQNTIEFPITQELEEEQKSRIEFIDSQNRIWATSPKGLNIFDPSHTQCRNYYYTTQFPKAYHVINELNVDATGNKAYMAVFGSDGLYVYDFKENEWATYQALGREGQVFDATSVQVDASGRVIVVAFSNVYYLNELRKKLIPLPLPFSLDGLGSSIKSLFDAKRNALWIEFSRSLVRLDLSQNTYKHYKEFPPYCNKSTQGPSLFLDSKGRLWHTGSCEGFSILEPETGHIWTQKDFSELDSIAEHLEIVSVAEQKDSLYLLSIDMTLIKIPLEDLGKRESVIFDIKTLLKENQLRDQVAVIDMASAQATNALFDEEGNYLILTPFGLFRVNFDTHKGEVFDHREGFVFKDKELNIPVAEMMISMPDGKILYGTRKGIHLFDPKKLQKNHKLPKPYIRNIDINDAPFPTDSSFFFKKNYSLEAGQYYISFDFSALDQSSSADRKYKHMLEGVDKDWRTLKDRNSISYPNVKGGNYTFKLMAGNEKGIWNPKVARANISIEKFWYNTYVARAFAITFLICLFILWYHYKVKRAIEKEQMKTSFEKKLAEVKMNALTAQMNPHFIFNSLNSIDYFIIKNESEQASEYLNRFSRLIRLILNNSRSNYISLKEDLDALKLYIEIESLRFDNKFTYEVKASKNLDPELIQVPPMLFQPYVENAIWHGLMQKEGPGKIEVTVRLDERKEIIIGTIVDNGIGREKAMKLKSKGANRKKNKSMGMQITQDKIEAINFLHDLDASVSVHDLFDEAGNAAGTKVVLEIPI